MDEQTPDPKPEPPQVDSTVQKYVRELEMYMEESNCSIRQFLEHCAEEMANLENKKGNRKNKSKNKTP